MDEKDAVYESCSRFLTHHYRRTPRQIFGDLAAWTNPLYHLHIPGVNNIFYGSRFMRVVLGTWWRERSRR